MRKITYSHLFPTIKDTKSNTGRCRECNALPDAAVLKWTRAEGERVKLKCGCGVIEYCEVK